MKCQSFEDTLFQQTGARPCQQRPLETPCSSAWVPLKGKLSSLDQECVFFWRKPDFEASPSRAIAPRSPKWKLARSIAAPHAVEAPSEDLVGSPFASNPAVWGCVCYLVNPFLGACWKSSAGEVQHVLYLQITLLFRSSGVTTDRCNLQSLKKYHLLLKAGQH